MSGEKWDLDMWKKSPKPVLDKEQVVLSLVTLGTTEMEIWKEDKIRKTRENTLVITCLWIFFEETNWNCMWKYFGAAKNNKDWKVHNLDIKI